MIKKTIRLKINLRFLNSFAFGAYNVLFFSGKRGIRTPGTVTRTLDFESSPFNHSGSFPYSPKNIAKLHNYKLITSKNTQNSKQEKFYSLLVNTITPTLFGQMPKTESFHLPDSMAKNPTQCVYL